MFAAVDLGSNSFRLHIARLEGGVMRVVKSARDPIRLGAGLDKRGNLTEQAAQTALECLKRFRTVLDGYTLEAVRVVATNTLRIARNAAAFLPAAEQAIGYPIEIISGEEEGRLIYVGVTSALAIPSEKRLVIDIGGGSTELILGDGNNIRHVESFSIGTVAHGASFLSDGRLDADSFDSAILSARSVFEDAAPSYRPQYWSNAYGSSGTIRAISEVMSKNAIGDGTLSLKNMEALKARLIGFRNVADVDFAGIKPERVTVMIGGLAILIGILRELGIKEIAAVDAGLRMGVLWDLQLRATRHDRREQSVRAFMRRFHADESRAARVADTALALFNLLKPGDDAHAKYLHWSGLLHEIGMAVSHTGYHKHAAYMVEYADLPGFTTREQRLMGTLILGQKGNLRKIGEALSDPDLAKAVLALRLAAMFMHARIDADVGKLRLKMKNRIELELKRDWVVLHPTVSYWIEKERGFWEEVGIELVVKAG
jgi:exopolyphosphatase / guanosine-5'-triphosphate,3'-diphosphate pyrophosphatase